MAAVAAVIAVCEQVGEPEQLTPVVPVILAKPSVNTTMLLAVEQSYFPWAINSLSAFTIPSCKLVLPAAIKLVTTNFNSSAPVTPPGPSVPSVFVNILLIVAVVLKVTIATLFLSVGLFAGRNTLSIKSFAAFLA